MEFRVLGPLEIVGTVPTPAPQGAKERAILLRLLIDPGRPVSTDALLEAAWPGAPPDSAARSLGVRLAHLRAYLEPGRPRGAPPTLLVRDGPGYRLAIDPECVDARRFERLVVAAASAPPLRTLAACEDALALWRGDPFADVAGAEFAQAEVRRLRELRSRAEESRARALVELGRHAEALPDLHRLADEEPLREELIRLLALALYRAGRQVDALDVLRRLAGALRELGLEPSTPTADLERRILRHDPALAGPADRGAPRDGGDAAPPGAGGADGTAPRHAARRAPAVAAGRVPVRASRFFGRAAHLAEGEKLVATCPLVTIAGVGGAGKTRLALELAGRAGERFPDGVWWCELAPVSRDGDVPGALARALGIELTGDAVERLLEHLADRRGLLALDNCEHVLDGAAAVTETLVTRCPGLRVLATSRAPLGVDGERVLRLVGLELPAGTTPAALAASPAVELFLDRARAGGGVVDGERDLEAVADVCRRLDGLPLAIELAAGRTRSMTVAEIATRLDERLKLLTVPGRRAVRRHSTLRAAIAWSYDLLDDPAQRVFRRLSVFHGPWTLQAAQDVAGGEGIDAGEMAEILDGLVAHSMVTARPVRGRTRYGMLETLREFARARLAEHGELESARDRHADHHVACVRAMSVDFAAWRADGLPFADAFDDLRAAMRWCLEHDAAPDRAVTLTIPLWATAHSCHAREIADLTERVLERWPREGTPEWIDACGTAATARLVVGDPEGARRHAEAGIALEPAFGRPAVIARRARALLAFYFGDPAEALPLLHDVRDLALAAGDPPVACEVTGFIAQALALSGSPDEAIATAAEMRAFAQRLGFAFSRSWASYTSGIVALERDPAQAHRWFQDGLEFGERVRHHNIIRCSLRALGVAALLDGAHGEAARQLLAALDHDEAASDEPTQWVSIVAMALLLAECGRTTQAAELVAACDAASTVAPLDALEKAVADRARRHVAACAVAPATGDLREAKALARRAVADLLRDDAVEMAGSR